MKRIHEWLRISFAVCLVDSPKLRNVLIFHAYHSVPLLGPQE
jgi:hypothetical protein